MTTLPKGWSETEPRSNRPGTYRYEVRAAQRFRVGTLRTVTLEGVAGVKLIAGKLRPGDRELARHGADSMVPQAIVFAKPNWPRFRDALEWQISHFTRLENPPRRLEDFKRGASDAIAVVVKLDTAIAALFVKALEMDAGGEGIPEKLRHRIRTLQIEKKAALENVKRAIARHGAAIGEFHVPRSRRANPSDRGGRAAAVRLYEEFHGVAPKGFTTKHVPDLSQLVHLGRALRVDYEAARPRGPRGTPYRHAFDAGSELFTDRTGRALVILGNIKVSRAPRGRFGYIRAGAGED